MSTRPYLGPYSVITNGSMAGNLTSSVTLLQNLTKIAYQVSWSGTSPVGTLSVQASSDYALNPDGTVANSGTWTTLTLSVNGSPSSTVAVSGNTGSAFIDLTVTSAWALRLIYTSASGTGTLNAKINGKVS